MKKCRCLLSLLCALSLVTTTSTSAAPLSQEQLEAIAIQPSSNWGKGDERVVPEMLQLFKEETIKFDNRTVKYRLHVPENLEEGKKYPLLLWLHGIGEVGTNNKAQLIHLHHIITYLTGEKKRDFFLLVPQHTSGEHWARGDRSTQTTGMMVPAHIRADKEALEKYMTDMVEQIKASSPPNAEITVEERIEKFSTQRREGAIFGFGGRIVEEEREELLLLVTVSTGENDLDHPLEQAFAMIEQIAENYPVDRNRITVSGLSSGGDGTWRALERRPDLFAAAVPLVSWTALSEVHLEKHPILKKIPIWAIYSSDDRSIDSARAQFERAEKAGCNVKKTEFGICGHNAWTPAMLQADIFAWLLSRAKDGERYYAVYDPGVDPDDLKGIIDVATRDTSPAPALAPAVNESRERNEVERPDRTVVPPELPGVRQARRVLEEAQKELREELSVLNTAQSPEERRASELRLDYLSAQVNSAAAEMRVAIERGSGNFPVPAVVPPRPVTDDELRTRQAELERQIHALGAQATPENLREISGRMSQLSQEKHQLERALQMRAEAIERGGSSPPAVSVADRLSVAEVAKLQDSLALIDSHLDILKRTKSNPNDPRIRAATQQRDRIMEQIASRLSAAPQTTNVNQTIRQLNENLRAQLEALNAQRTPENSEEISVQMRVLAEAHNQMVRATLERAGVAADGARPSVTTQRLVMPPPVTLPVMNAEKEKVYIEIARQYYQYNVIAQSGDEALEKFTGVFRKLSPKAQMELITELVDARRNSLESLQLLEGLLDGIPGTAQERGSVSPPMMMRPVPEGQTPPAPRVESAPSISAARIIEECDRPWAMTSESLYGMFPADWNKEADAIPDFIVNTDTEELAKRLARSVGEDPESKDFVAACRSILQLQHRPMSSPWFETSGGRLQSEIQYSLSSKGQMFVRFLRTVKDSTSTEKARELSKVAERTLEKIEMVLEK